MGVGPFDCVQNDLLGVDAVPTQPATVEVLTGSVQGCIPIVEQVEDVPEVGTGWPLAEFDSVVQCVPQRR
jgi:hypothetical protein